MCCILLALFEDCYYTLVGVIRYCAQIKSGNECFGKKRHGGGAAASETQGPVYVC